MQLSNLIFKQKKNIFFFCAFALFSISFLSNIFQIAHKDATRIFRYDDGFVLGRLIANEQESYFSYGMLTGTYLGYPLHDSDTLRIGNRNNTTINKSFNDFITDNIAGKGTMSTYNSLPGGQAMLISFFQAILPINNGLFIPLMRLLTVLLTALMLTLFTRWVSNTFGFFTSIVTFVFLLTTPWFIPFASSYWWALWSYYSSFILVLFVVKKQHDKHQHIFTKKIYILIFYATFLKFFFTGAEFISSFLIMIFCPLIFYMCLDETHSLKQKISKLIRTSLVSISAILAGFILLSLQIYALTGDWLAGPDHIIDAFFRRAVVNEADFTVWSILSDYIFKGSPFGWGFYHINSSFFTFILIAIISAIIILMFNRNNTGKERKLRNALIVTTATSITAPLSWFIIFTEHCYIHTFVDYIVWYFPFLLFVFVLVGVSINSLWTKVVIGR